MIYLYSNGETRNANNERRKEMTTYQLYIMILGGLSNSATNKDRETAKIYLSELYKRIFEIEGGRK